MKKRLIIALSLTLFIIIGLPIALVLSSIRSQGLFLVLAMLGLVYVAVYVFGGLAKLIIYFIYGLTTSLFLVLLPEIYQVPFVLIGSLLFVLNPLANFEEYLIKKMNDEETLPMRISIRGSYWPFFSYRREMKNYFHLPQSKKLFTKQWYKYLRQTTTLTLLFIGIFLFIHEISSIALAISTLDPIYFLSFYSVFIFFLLAFLLYKKGFTSGFRALLISIFPTLIFIVFLTSLNQLPQLIVALAILILGIVVTVFETIKYYQRVVYESYRYYDVDLQQEVYANALFEPLVYNDTYTLSGHYMLDMHPDDFDLILKDLLVYINYFKMILVAYTLSSKHVELTVHLHHKQEKRAEKFKTYLETKVKTKVPMTLINDPTKAAYEKAFFHRPDYIIARATHLANLLKELQIQSRVIISLIAYFKTEKELLMFAQMYQIKRLTHLDEANLITISIDTQVVNNDFIIEHKIREILLDLMTFKGKYVRINVYY